VLPKKFEHSQENSNRQTWQRGQRRLVQVSPNYSAKHEAKC